MRRTQSTPNRLQHIDGSQPQIDWWKMWKRHKMKSKPKAQHNQSSQEHKCRQYKPMSRVDIDGLCTRGIGNGAQ
eukprot:Skav222067  [mRNA]  locus=scaffold707:300215:300436:+ [translate_table: standard]